MKDEALKLALDALEREEYRLRQTGQSQVYSGIGFAITAIKQALAAPVQEPVKARHIGWDYLDNGQMVATYAVPVNAQISPDLYTTPPAQRQWVGLTDEEIKGSDWVLSAVKEYEAYTLQEELVIEGVAEFAHAIEAKLKEKNDAAQPPVPDALNPKDENPAYAAGWNDCRAEMLKGMKP